MEHRSHGELDARKQEDVHGHTPGDGPAGGGGGDASSTTREVQELTRILKEPGGLVQGADGTGFDSFARGTADRRAVLVGTAAAATGAVLFGASYVATAFALRSFTPLAAAFWRGAATAVLLGAWLAIAAARARSSRPCDTGARRGRALGPVLVRLFALGLLSGPLFIVGMNVAVGQSGAAVAAFVAGLYSLSAALFAPVVLKEPLRAAALVGFGLALVGIALLTGYQPSGSPVGIAFGLLAAVTFGLYLVLSRRWSEPWGLDPVVIVLAANTTTAVTLLAIESVREPAAILPADPRPDALAAMAFLVVMVSIVASLLVVVSVRLIPAERSSAFLLLNPPSATLLAWLLLGESLNAAQLAGGALVLAGIAIASVQRGRRGGQSILT